MLKPATQPDDLALFVHYLLPRSFANGPGARFVIWTQGCSLGCPGCFNPETHANTQVTGMACRIDELMARICEAASNIEGITISGGEPLEQPDALQELLKRVRTQTNLGVILFSGFSMAEIQAVPSRMGVLNHVDALLAGRYEARYRIATALRGSLNKQLVLLTGRYSLADFDAVPPTEIIIETDGQFVATGIRPVQLPRGESF